MGWTQATDLAEQVREGTLSLRQALDYHLTTNHFPPIPAEMITPCMAAIFAWDDGEIETQIVLPGNITYRDRKTAPAWAIIHTHHLEAFLTREEDY